VNDLKAFWVAFFRPGSNISIRPCGLAIHRSPTFSDRSSSSLELSVLFSVLFQPPAFRACRAPHLSMVHPVCQKAPPLGFSPSSRLQSAQLGRGLPLPRPGFTRVSPVQTRPFGRSALGVLHAFDGFFRHRPCELVSSRCRVQGFPLQGFFPHSEPFQLSLAVAFLSFLHRACGLTRAVPMAVDFKALLPE
jgi:hypothetical protein